MCVCVARGVWGGGVGGRGWGWGALHSEVRSCVEVEVVVLVGSPSLTVRTVSVDVK